MDDGGIQFYQQYQKQEEQEYLNLQEQDNDERKNEVLGIGKKDRPKTS